MTHLNFNLTIHFCYILLMIMASVSVTMGSTKKTCGDVLNEALEVLCSNGFSKRLKRELEMVKQIEYSGTVTKIPPVKGWQRSVVHPLIKPHPQQDGDLRRPRRRIAHECCKNECSYDDILAYCKSG